MSVVGSVRVGTVVMVVASPPLLAHDAVVHRNAFEDGYRRLLKPS